jgi:hypothetical protein
MCLSLHVLSRPTCDVTINYVVITVQYILKKRVDLSWLVSHRTDVGQQVTNVLFNRKEQSLNLL